MVTQLTTFNDLRQKVVFFVKKLKLNQYINNQGRKLALSISDILSLALFKHAGQIETKKKLWQHMRPKCSYKTMVVNVNRFFWLALYILTLILNYNKQNAHLVKFIDSTDIPVCQNRKAKFHKAMRQFARWSKTGKGWFYGLKMHLIADLEGKVLAIKFTAGNIDDREVVLDLAKGLDGIFVADAGYIKEKLGEEFYEEGKRILLVKPRANMKKLATLTDVYLYSQRMRIELNFRTLKMFYGLITSLPRSVLGYLANYSYAILAYCLA
jgi:transposase